MVHAAKFMMEIRAHGHELPTSNPGPFAMQVSLGSPRREPPRREVQKASRGVGHASGVFLVLRLFAAIHKQNLL